MPRAVSKRLAPLSVRLSEAERESLTIRAGAQPLSTYIKRALFDGAAPVSRGMSREDRTLLAHLLATLGKSNVAPNLERLAQAAESGNLFADEDTTGRLRQACDDVRLMHNALMRGLGKKERTASNREVQARRQFQMAAHGPEDPQ